jgi:hypothetical protein
MLDRIKQFFSPRYRRVVARRRLERIAREAGASKTVALKICAAYFRKSKKEAGNVAQ